MTATSTDVSSSPTRTLPLSLLPLAEKVAELIEDRLTTRSGAALRSALAAFSAATGTAMVLDDDLDEGVTQAVDALNTWVAGFRI